MVEEPVDQRLKREAYEVAAAREAQRERIAQLAQGNRGNKAPQGEWEEVMGQISVNWIDADTDQEIEGWFFPVLDVRPMVGDAVHYWQDGTAEAATGGGLDRRDYVVTKVEHDLRFMPARGGSPKYVHSLVVYLRATP